MIYSSLAYIYLYIFLLANDVARFFPYGDAEFAMSGVALKGIDFGLRIWVGSQKTLAPDLEPKPWHGAGVEVQKLPKIRSEGRLRRSQEMVRFVTRDNLIAERKIAVDIFSSRLP